MAHTTSAPLLSQVPLKHEDRPRYTDDQLQTYFERIHLPSQYRHSTERNFTFLQVLTRYHAANVPFENLELHYSAHKTISLNMDDLYAKFAERGLNYGRGGRCMENNGFFGTVLRSLGFHVRNCAGRVSRSMSPIQRVREEQGQTYDGWNHMLNLVLLSGDWYVVDVGMGAMGPNIPYKLEDGMERESIAPRRIRLQKRAIPESYSDSGQEAQKFWCYDVCYKPDDSDPKWTPAYCFTETEFLPQDYEMMSWFTSTNKKCFFTYSVVCTKMLLDDAGEKIVGDVTLYNDGVRKNVGKSREIVREMKTEGERVEALSEIFGVELTEEEREGMRGDLKLQ